MSKIDLFMLVRKYIYTKTIVFKRISFDDTICHHDNDICKLLKVRYDLWTSPITSSEISHKSVLTFPYISSSINIQSRDHHWDPKIVIVVNRWSLLRVHFSNQRLTFDSHHRQMVASQSWLLILGKIVHQNHHSFPENYKACKPKLFIVCFTNLGNLNLLMVVQF